MSEKEIELRALLEQVLDDATGDINNFEKKRNWAIRASLYRKIAAAIDYKFDSARALMSQEKYDS